MKPLIDNHIHRILTELEPTRRGHARKVLRESFTMIRDYAYECGREREAVGRELGVTKNIDVCKKR